MIRTTARRRLIELGEGILSWSDPAPPPASRWIMIGPGRNRPCPCGSGKKFKQCHGKPGRATTSPEDRAWQELRRALDGFQAMMLRFTKQVYGVGAVHEAWAEFLLWPEDDPAFDAETAHMPLFMPWFFHRWAPDPRETSILDADLHDRSPTSVLLERRGRRLDPRLRRYLEVCGDAPFSFHEIVRCDPGVGFRTRDIFVGAEHDVAERAASRILQVGDAFFGQIVASDGVALLEACGPYVISPRDKIGLIELRERMSAGVAPPTTETLGEWDFELRDAYLDLAVLHRTPPEVRNTDGEDVEFHRLDFEIESAQRAFDALKHLALDETDDELLEAAEMDEGGRVRRVSFPWKVADDRVHAGWDSTVLGHLEIDGTRLVVSVNSAERAERIMRIMEERLGQGARLAGTDIQSIEDAVRESGPAPSAAADVVEHPEVRERIRQLMSSHYESWVSEKIPALDDLSPLEAVQAPAGREKVKALVDQIERDGSRMEPPLDPGIVRDLRQRLGLS